MSQIIETPRGIALACDERDERSIERDLKQLDPDLFLTKEVHRPTGARCYSVYEYQSPTQAPLHVIYWTEDRKRTGKPLPLSSGLVYEVESRKRFAGRNLAAEAAEANDAIQERLHEQADEEMEEEVIRYHRRRLRLGSGQNVKRFFQMGRKS